MNFDQTRLANPQVVLGSGVPAAPGTTLITNTSQAANGRLGIVLDNPNGFGAVLTSRELVRVTFQVISGTPAGSTLVSFGNIPVARGVSDITGADLATGFEGNNIVLGGLECTTAAGVTVSGRVMTASGAGLRNATVVFIDAEGNRRSVITSSLGYYQIDDVEAGGIYVVSVAARRFRYASRLVQVTDNLTDLDFVGLE